ncbi:MAG TPA: acetyl-CoA carboxylase biotin carboxyl carrier protein [Paracoccus sp. (in: a-proteobacteria)]|nr:acetyl-CoA carboxylase biotin carboxyl carrier protein [Paracoccus sp. (in: a-proteobacteria)]
MGDNNDGKHHEGDVAFIQALAELLNRNELTEISVKREYGENDRLTVQLSKQNAPAIMQPAPVFAQVPAAAPAAAAAAPPTGDPASLPGAVTSPMVGTVYLAAEPGAQPFATIGQQVAEGDTLLIVEAMKTMNHIPAPRAGTIRRILVEDGSPVEFGTPLMVIE